MEALKVLLIVVVAMTIGAILDERRKRRLGIKDEPPIPKRKKHKADWVSDKNYDKFLRTGNRNYLWKDDYDRDSEC